MTGECGSRVQGSDPGCRGATQPCWSPVLGASPAFRTREWTEDPRHLSPQKAGQLGTTRGGLRQGWGRGRSGLPEWTLLPPPFMSGLPRGRAVTPVPGDGNSLCRLPVPRLGQTRLQAGPAEGSALNPGLRPAWGRDAVPWTPPHLSL